MQIQRSIPRLFVVPSLLCCLLFISCASQGMGNAPQQDTASSPRLSQATGTSTFQSDKAVPPVILRNPAPGQLEVSIDITMGGYERTNRGMTTIGLGFLSNGRPVQFAGNEHLTCIGHTVPLHNLIAFFQIAQAPTDTLEGRTLSCTYSVGGVSTTLAFAVPFAPVILSPRDLAQAPRSTDTLITYHVQGGELQGIVALRSGTKALARLDTLGSMRAVVNTSAFPAGVGSISLSQTLALQATQSGTPFKALHAEGTGMTMVTVTWV